MVKILKIILAAGTTLAAGTGLFYCLISGAPAAALEGKTENYVLMSALLCIFMIAFFWSIGLCFARKNKRLKEQDERIELLMKQNNEISIKYEMVKYENEILMKKRDKLDK